MRIDLELLYHLRAQSLSEADRKLVEESITTMEQGENLNRGSILKLVDVAVAHGHPVYAPEL
ncbi:MAG: hypothetical protein LAQ69_13820 [Acidobacteriia bacterium]|nr:hypothetical protein [Terriglobia bacterium]